MNVLAIDTSTSMLGIGLQTDEHYFEMNQDVGLHHTENLLTEVQVLLAKAVISVEKLDLIVVSKGPGSFTGLRIGLSTAKGLSFGTGIPLVSVPTLDMHAFGQSITSTLVVPVMDARKKRVYAAFYKHGKVRGEVLDIKPDLLLQEMSEYNPILLTGPFAAELIKIGRNSEIPSENLILDPLHAAPKTFALLHKGIEMFHQRGGDEKRSGPLYIRPSEAELSLQRGGNEQKTNDS